MKSDEILELAKYAGFVSWSQNVADALVEFFTVAVEYEREACAKVCENLKGTSSRRCAEAIRARGQG